MRGSRNNFRSCLQHNMEGCCLRNWECFKGQTLGYKSRAQHSAVQQGDPNCSCALHALSCIHMCIPVYLHAHSLIPCLGIRRLHACCLLCLLITLLAIIFLVCYCLDPEVREALRLEAKITLLRVVRNTNSDLPSALAIFAL